MQHDDENPEKPSDSAQIIELPSVSRRFEFKLPRVAKVRDDEETLNKIKHLASLQCTQKEAAGALGISAGYFEQFLSAHPHLRDAWWEGRQNGKVSLRRKLWEMAQDNTQVAMFLAKDDRWLGMNPQKPATVIDQRQVNVFTDEDNKKRIAELLALAKGNKPNEGA